MISTTVVVNSDPGFLDCLTAIGTIGAAGFAGWAALAARSAARAASDLVRIEADRDQTAAEVERWRQARRVVVRLGV